jgi:hypothetical protein
LGGSGAAFRPLGTRAPQLIARYYYEATKVFLRAEQAGFSAEKRFGVEVSPRMRAPMIESDELELYLGYARFRAIEARECFLSALPDRSLAPLLCRGWVGRRASPQAQRS